jgi:hypothetical protein
LSSPHDLSDICLKLEHEGIEGSNGTVHVLHSSSSSKSNTIKSV